MKNTADNTSSVTVQTTAPPPWHTVAVLGIMTLIFITSFPSWQDVDQAATIETFTHRVFPQYMSLGALAYTRLLCCLLIWGTTIECVFFGDG
jgi:hypothetical protein